MRSAVFARRSFEFDASRVLAATAALLLFALPSHAAVYSDVVGSTVQFSGINDEGGLWTQPTGAGDQLIFNPTAYTAGCPGAGCPAGAVEVDDTLEFTITANPGESLSILLFEEFGTANIVNAGGTAQVGIDALITQVSITALDGTAVNTIGASGGNLVFTPGDTFNTDGVTAFSGSVSVDLDAIIAAAFPLETRSATTVTIIMNNPLTAFAFGGAAAGSITKDELRVTIVPEPGSTLLMMLGLMGLASVRRSSKPILSRGGRA